MSRGLLTVDNGNSHPHIGIFHQGHLDAILSFKDFESYKQDFFEDGQYDVVISNVGEQKEILRDLEKHAIDLAIYKTDKLFLDMPFHYAQSIGDDRLYESYFIYRNKILSDADTNRVLLIDAGTFITIDIISLEGLEGGFILPGGQLLLDSFRKGARLPSMHQSLLKLGTPWQLPHNTEDALLESTKGMISGFFAKFFELHGKFDQVVITGGQGLDMCSLLRAHAPSSLELEIIPDLIHYSLSAIHQSITAPNFQWTKPKRRAELRSVT